MKKCLNMNNLLKTELKIINRGAFQLLKNCVKNITKLEYNLEQVKLEMCDEMGWINPESSNDLETRFYTDFTKPLLLVGPKGNKKISIINFLNTDLHYLRHEDKEGKYAFSLTKYLTTRYDINGIERDIDILFSPKVAKYDVDTMLGIYHWPTLRKNFYKAKVGFSSGEEVYSNFKIVIVIHVVERQLDYGLLTKIKVLRDDGNEYTFMESDYLRLNLNDIKDMYVLKVQGKLHHLPSNTEYDLKNLSSVEQVTRESGVVVTKGCLVFLVNQEIIEDALRVEDYKRMSCQLKESARRRNEYISALKACPSGGNSVENLRFMERMRLEDLEKGTRLLLMMKETKMKIAEKIAFVSTLGIMWLSSIVTFVADVGQYFGMGFVMVNVVRKSYMVVTPCVNLWTGGEEVEFDVDLVLIQVMRCITSLKCVLTQEHLDAICAKYFVPEEVHPQLPSSDATMHERPTGKIGMYTRFFDYANY
ncbi:hypothetical protein Tco_1120488, partial [Tanacetum coccineum]